MLKEASSGRFTVTASSGMDKLSPAPLLLFIAAALFLASGCGEGYREIQSNEVLPFLIPIDRGDGTRDSTTCLVSVPPGYSTDRRWPVLVALHGYGSGCGRFHALWHETATTSGFVLVTPQAEQHTEEAIGWSWGEHAEMIVMKSIEAAARSVKVDAARIYLTGFSQGGILTYTLTMRYPHVFRGIAPIGAGRDLPDPAHLDLFSGIRVYMGHGSLEPRLEEVRRFAADLRGRGCTVMLREYQGIGHGLPDPAGPELKRILEFLDGPH